MAVKSRLKTFTYRYPDGQSSWTFRAETLDGDEDAVQALVSETVQQKISAKEYREARRAGPAGFDELVMSKITTETKMSAKRAWLTHMSVEASGPEVTVPEGYAKGEETGKPERDPETGDYIPHPLIGQIHPLTAEWIATHPPDELTDIYETLEEVWSGRSDADQDAFSGVGARLEQHGSVKRRAKA